jgi:hypothetical protein
VNISEANAVITVLRWVLRRPPVIDMAGAGQAVETEPLVKAVGFLADRSHRATYAGLHPVEAEKAARDLLAAGGQPGTWTTDARVVGFQAAAAEAFVRRLDGDDLVIAGQEWTADAPPCPGSAVTGTVLDLFGPAGTAVRVRVVVELIEGALS